MGEWRTPGRAQARAAVSGRHGSRRVASSVWLPWGVGGVLLLLLAVVALTAGGRVEPGVRVPRAVLDGTLVALPQTQAREQALLFGLLLLVLSLGVFGWLYAMVLRPLQRVRLEAERLASGDLQAPVEIRRYDEIGLIAHSLEQTRLLLISLPAQRSTPSHAESENR
jgi:methyl-accepting chemotaxis protein